MEFEPSVHLNQSLPIISDAWQVEMYDVSHSDQRNALIERLANGRVSCIHDTIQMQLVDYLRSTNPRSKATDRELLEAHMRDERIESLTNFGVWIFYPWSGRLVHTLPSSLFHRLRTDRNRHKITMQEQDRLRSATIGIVGLSAGMAVATSMVLEGVGGRFRLADFDTLGLSNLNRIQASIADIGIAKTTIAARTMLEMNPFLDIQLFPKGVTEDTVCQFFDDNGSLDVLVEECDSLWMKVRLREEAKRRGIPVVMDTSDRGLLDVERFDLEKDRPIFHNLLAETDSKSIRELSDTERIGLVLRILGAEKISPNACASLLEIGHSISTWPQLGSSVIAGGAVVTDATRRVLLNTFTESGRYSVDLESLVGDGAGQFRTIDREQKLGKPAFAQEYVERPPIQDSNTISDLEFSWLISQASLAPSGGNVQPWRFALRDGSILGYLATDRRSAILDFNYHASLLALGAAAENMMLAAPELNLEPSLKQLDWRSPTDPFFRIRFRRNDHATRDLELFPCIGRRCTNRRLGPPQALHPSHLESLIQEADKANAELVILTEHVQREAIAKIIGQGERLRFLSESLHREMMNELRWSAEEAEAKRDGIDIATLEIPEASLGILKLLSSWPAMKRLREVGGGAGLETPSQEAIAASSAFVLLRSKSKSPVPHFDGGRSLQRVWLRATSVGISIQPMSVLVYLFERIENGDASSLDDETRSGLNHLLQQYREHFPRKKDTTDMLLFRMTYADPPTTRSLRLRLEDIIA